MTFEFEVKSGQLWKRVIIANCSAIESFTNYRGCGHYTEGTATAERLAEFISKVTCREVRWRDDNGKWHHAIALQSEVLNV